MQARGATLAPGIVFDSDMGRNIDTALALAIFHGLGRGRLIAVGISYSNLDCAAFCDAMARFYIGDAAGRNLPVGLAENGPKLEDTALLSIPPAMRGGIRSVTDTGDPPVVFRNALLTQQEKQSIAVLAGPATNLAQTLALYRARDIVASKVRLLVMAAGEFGGAATDPRIRADIASARKVLAEWPSPIVAVGLEAGNTVPFPHQTIETGFEPMPNHPVVGAYRAYREKHPGSKNAPTQAVLAALYAANPGAEYFKLSPPGTIEVADDGRTQFKESAAGNHRYLIIEPMQKESVTQAFIALATARPATGRGAPRN